MLDLIIALHEGFDAIPTKLGSEVRPRGQVDDFGSGVIEGGKGLFWGWWDGITGLATEPVAGGKKEVSREGMPMLMIRVLWASLKAWDVPVSMMAFVR